MRENERRRPIQSRPSHGGPIAGQANWLLLVLAAAVAGILWFVFLRDEPTAPPTQGVQDPPGRQATESPDAATSETASESTAGSEQHAAQRSVADPKADRWILAGTVLRQKEPVAGWKLRIEQFVGYEIRGDAIRSTEVESGSDGRFAWPIDAPTGTVTFRVQSAKAPKPEDDFRVRPVEVTVPAGDPAPTSIKVVVTPLEATIVGRVTDPEGQPVAGARLKQWRNEPVVSGPDGTYRMRTAANRRVQLYVRAGGFTQKRVSTQSKGPGEEVTCDVQLQPGLTVRGIVVDEHQRPLAGARVATFYTAFGGWVEAGADGRFVIDYLEPGRPSHSIFARVPGYVEARTNVETESPEDEYRLVMRRGVRVLGRTLDPNGRPMPGVSIYVGFSDSDFSKLTTTSNDRGEYEFAAVDHGKKQLVADRKGFATSITKLDIPKAGPAMRVDLRLERGKAMAGRIVDGQGKPVAKVYLSVLEAGNGHRYIGDRAVTEEDGKFRLEGLPTGKVKLEVYGTGWVRLTTDDLETGQENLELTLTRSAGLAGTVVDAATGKPIPEFTIRFRSNQGGYSAIWVREGRKFESATGVWSSGRENLKAGVVFTVEASADGYATGKESITSTIDPKSDASVIRLQRGQTIEGRVVAAKTGLPVAGARLVLATEEDRQRVDHHEDFYGRETATSDGNGLFRLANVPSGEVLIALRHPDWARTMHGPFTVAQGTPLRSVVIQAAQWCSIRLRVIDTEGQPVAGLPLMHTPFQKATTDAAGTVHLSKLEPGPFQFWAQSTGPTPQTVWNLHGTLEPGQAAEWTMRPGPCELDCELLGTEEPLGGNAYLSRKAATRSPRYRLTAQHSRIHVRGLPAGTFMLWFSSRAGLGSKTITLTPGNPLTTKLEIKQPGR